MEKSTLKVRWLVLVLSCISMIGNYYCFDNPSALKMQLQSYFSSRYSSQQYEVLFNFLYTVYSVPNIFLPFVGGILVDKFGTRSMLFVFSVLILTGQILFTFGASVTSFNIMMLGRVLFGFGGESLGVAQSTLVASWFKNKELALALGINLSIARMGSVINNIISPSIADASNVTMAFLFGVFMCVVSLVATLIVIPIDKKTEEKIRANSHLSVKAVDEVEKIKCSDIKHFKISFWLLSLSCLVVYGCVLPFNNIASSLLMERDYFKEPSAECARCGTGEYINMTICDTVKSKCPPVPPFAWPLPKLSANCVIKNPSDQYNCSSNPPYIRGNSFDCGEHAWKNGPFTKSYCLHKAKAEKTAATPMSVPYLISAFISPFLGMIVDRIGKRALLACLAPVVLSVVHLLLAVSSINVYVPLVLQGISYSVFAAALWPSVPYVVESRFVGSAYGTITSIQNMGLAIFPLFVAAIYDAKEKYIPNVELLFVGFGVLGTFIGGLLNLFDYRNGSVLNNSRTKGTNTTVLIDNSAAEALLDPTNADA